MAALLTNPLLSLFPWRSFCSLKFSFISQSQVMVRTSRSADSTPRAYDAGSRIYTSDRSDIHHVPESEAESHHDFVNFILRSSQKLTFHELEEETRALALGLTHHLGVQQGDVVMLLAPNSIHYPVAVMAIASIGAVVATPNPMGTSQDVQIQAQISEAKFILTINELLIKTEGLGLPTVVMDYDQLHIVESCNRSRTDLLLLSGLIMKTEGIRSRDLPREIRGQDPAMILYSSGTTGMSKAVMLSHANIISQIMQLVYADFTVLNPKVDELSFDVILCALPMSHIFGSVAVTLQHLYRRDQTIVLPGFQLGTMLNSIESFRISHIYVVPPVIVALTKFIQKSGTQHDLSTLRAVLCGAAPLGKKQIDCLFDFLPNASFVQLFGITETTGAVTLNDIVQTGNLSTVGTLLSNIEAKVVDVQSGEALPPNRQGELLLRGPTLMIGYMNNPQATNQSMTSDGWLRTGDLVYFDETGNMYVVDRIKELIKYKALQVAPAELEAILLTHPQILDAAVVRCKDEDAGEIPVAFVVPCPEGKLTEDEVKRFVAKHVAAHKRVRRVSFVDLIPKTPSGKILRRELTATVYV